MLWGLCSMDLDRFLDVFFADLKKILRSAHDQTSQVPLFSSGSSFERKQPSELSLDLGLELGCGEVAPVSFEDLFGMLQSTLRHSVNTNSPLFMNRLYSGAELAVSLFLFLFFFVFFVFKKRGLWPSSLFVP